MVGVRQSRTAATVAVVMVSFSEEFPMIHLKNAAAAYRMHTRCKSEGRDYEAESYYKMAQNFAEKHAAQIGSNRLNVMWDVLDQLFQDMIENPSNS
jgi:hypothetical protein